MSYDNNRTEFVISVRSIFVNEYAGAKYLRVHFVAIDTMTGERVPQHRRFKTNIQEYILDGEEDKKARERFITTVNAFRVCMGMEEFETMGATRILEDTQRKFMQMKEMGVSPKVLVSVVVNPELKTEQFSGQTMIFQWANKPFWKQDFVTLLNQEN